MEWRTIPRICVHVIRLFHRIAIHACECATCNNFTEKAIVSTRARMVQVALGMKYTNDGDHLVGSWFADITTHITLAYVNALACMHTNARDISHEHVTRAFFTYTRRDSLSIATQNRRWKKVRTKDTISLFFFSLFLSHIMLPLIPTCSKKDSARESLNSTDKWRSRYKKESTMRCSQRVSATFESYFRQVNASVVGSICTADTPRSTA